VQTSPDGAPGTTILVVDDDALITLSLSDQLADLGYRTLEAYSAPDALVLLDRHPEIGAMVTDFAMPVMTGVELAEAARAVRPDLPILLTTGYAELPEGLACDLPRLEKPFQEDQLVRKLNEVLGTLTGAAE
jgi:CheY-like chemotaxis protein